MYSFVQIFNMCIFALFTVCYAYQIVYVFLRLFRKTPEYHSEQLHRFAVVISARNEETVIGELLQSIINQDYPRELLDIYVVADNCTDETASVAKKNGAVVFKRYNRDYVGKGYALDFAFERIDALKGIRYYDGYFVFDADNVLDENFVREMNNVFGSGYRVVTSYRNSKNYDSNWISSGYALWFLRESKYLNGARMQCHTSCAISGTGFLVSSEIIEQNEGWKYHLLTEDIQFSVDNVLKGEVIGYCEKAVLYDEQPIRFQDSWRQRLRWAKGFLQVFRRYGKGLFSGVFRNKGSRFQCYDMLMTVSPITLLSLVAVIVNAYFAIFGFATGRLGLAYNAGFQALMTFFGAYLSLFLFGGITLITEWKQIHCRWNRKIGYLFTFPIFNLTYIPITITALFKKVTWEPIHHTISKNLQEIRQ